MAATARADIEAALRAKRLDHTLTSSLDLAQPRDESAWAPTGILALDRCIGGGIPRGQVSEVVGAATSGRTSLVLHVLAAATCRGELVALIDALDRLDVSSAAAAGIDLDRLLWIRGHVASHPGPCREANLRALEQAVKALTLVLHAGVCDVVVFDIADVPAAGTRRLPFTTWFRLHRTIESSRTACLIVSSAPIWRSPAGITLHMAASDASTGDASQRPSHARLFAGVSTTARMTRARLQSNDALCVSVSTTCA
jgi:hypothetical protein